MIKVSYGWFSHLLKHQEECIMKNSLFSRIVAGIVLVAFTVASCDTGFRPPKEGPIVIDPPPASDLRLFYLDSNNKPAPWDTGKIAMIAETEDAQGVAVVASNKLGGGIAVQVVNANNDSVVTFVYPSGKNFPSRVTINIGGEETEGKFSAYDRATETYSVTFSQDEETETFDNLFLNKNVFTLNQPNGRSNESQDARLQRITTTMALWASLMLQTDDDSGIGARAARGGGFWKKVVSTVLKAVAVVAVVVLIVIAPPLIITGGSIIIPLVTTAQIIVAAVALAAVAVAAVLDSIPSKTESPPQEPTYLPPGIRLPRVSVTENEKEMENFNAEARFAGYPSSMTFKIKLEERGDKGLEEPEIREIRAFDPDTYELLDENNLGNLEYFYDKENKGVNIEGSLDSDDGVLVTITNIKRNWNEPDGRICFAIEFNLPVVINGETRKGYVWNKGADALDVSYGQPGNYFGVNLTVRHAKLEVTQDFSIVINNGKTYSVDPKTVLDFDIEHLGGFTGPVGDFGQMFRAIDPGTGKLANPKDIGTFPFDLKVEGSNLVGGVRFSVSRNGKSRIDEIRDDTAQQLLVWFDTDVMINGRERGYRWNETQGRVVPAENGYITGNLFIINLKAVD